MPPQHAPGSAAKLLHVKSGLSQTPEFLELRNAIKTLHDDSKRKLDQDHEMQRALENLFGQVQAVREGLSTLSEAFIEESGKHHHRIVQEDRIVQVEKRIGALEQKHEDTNTDLQERLAADVQQTSAQIAETHKTCLTQIQAEVDNRQEAHQALREQLSSEISDLSVAAHTRLADLERTAISSVKEVAEQSEAAVTELASQHASLKEEVQQKHRAAVKHTQALTNEMTHLAEAYQHLDSLRQGQQASIVEVQTNLADNREEAFERLRELAEQIALMQQDSDDVNGESLGQLQQGLQALQQRVVSVDTSCGKRIQALRDDVSTSVRDLTEQREQAELASNELRTALQQAGSATEQKLDALKKRTQESVDSLNASLAKMGSAHDAAMSELRAEAGNSKAARDADLAIIERALGAAHANHESSDKVLQSTIASVKELESRCGTTAQQGDMLANSVNELDHRVTVMQRALLQTQHSDLDTGHVRPSRRQDSGHSSAGKAQSLV